VENLRYQTIILKPEQANLIQLTVLENYGFGLIGKLVSVEPAGVGGANTNRRLKMPILIDMEMPRGCMDCALSHPEELTCSPRFSGKQSSLARPDGCPLTEVQDFGNFHITGSPEPPKKVWKEV